MISDLSHWGIQHTRHRLAPNGSGVPRARAHLAGNDAGDLQMLAKVPGRLLSCCRTIQSDLQWSASDVGQC